MWGTARRFMGNESPQMKEAEKSSKTDLSLGDIWEPWENLGPGWFETSQININIPKT
jgi:hypothetical protein